MVIAAAAIQAPNLNATTQTNVNSHVNGEMSLESLVSPASAHDVSAFQSTIQNIIQQNASFSSSTYSAGSTSNIVTSMIDNIQNEKRRIADLAANISKLSAQGAIELQEATENFSLTTQLLSKGMTLVTKAIDGIVHVQ